MNTRIPLIVLLGTIASGRASSADPAAPKTVDAQAQAATLLLARLTPPSMLGIASPGRLTSAQTQAAKLLQANASDGTSAPQSASDSIPARAKLARKDGVSQDAQAQAQSILRTAGARSDKAIAVEVMAASHR